MKYTATAPSTEPVTLEEAKAHIRSLPDDTSEDGTIIEPLISAAREYCEGVTGRSLAAETITAYPERFETVMRLPRPPVAAITSVKYTEADGTVNVMEPSGYTADGESIVIYRIPAFAPAPLNPIEIVYTAGNANLPATIRQAMLLLIGHWYQNREAVVVGAVTSVEVQMTVDRLLKQHKVWWY